MSVVSTEQNIPTYIKEFLRQDLECILVHKKGSLTENPDCNNLEEWNLSSELKRPLDLNDLSMESILDLTGNPLHVDLHVSAMDPLSNIESAMPNWTIAESQHHPLGVDEARKLLNTKFNQTNGRIPAFCVTDGCDSQNTIIVGSHHSDEGNVRYLGQFMGVFPMNDEELSLKRLKEQHQKYVRVQADSMKVNFKRIYNIHGNLPQEVPLAYSKCNGCMFIETSWNEFSKTEPSLSETNMNMVLKVVAGHKNSCINFLWKQLGRLEKYLKLLSAGELEENTVLSEKYLPLPDLTEGIHNLCYTNIRKKKELNNETLDFENLRDKNILDNIWSLFNKCQNLHALKSAFSIFFKLAKFENIDVDDSVVAELLKQYLETDDYISKLTVSESLKLLVYLGLEKMKQDYMTIVNFYHPVNQSKLDKMWSDFQVKNLQKTKRVTEIFKSCKLTDTTFNSHKMDFLKRLHYVSEILVFLKQEVGTYSKLSFDNFSLICKHVYQKYITNKSEKICDTLPTAEMLVINCDLNSTNNEIYKEKNPVTSIFEFVSKVGRTKVQTIFHVSEKPIFPPCIYNEYGEDEKSFSTGDIQSAPLLYCSKLVVLA